MRLFIYFLSIIIIFTTFNVQAQNPVEISQDKISDLIETLESDSARQEFLDNLKALTEVSDEDEESATLDLGLDGVTNKFVGLYKNFIKNTGFNENIVGQISLTIGVIIAALILAFIIRKISHVIRNKLNKIRDHYQLHHDRFRLYIRYIRYVGYAIITLFALYTIGVIWGMTEGDFTFDETSRIFLVNFSNIAIVISIAIIIFELLNTVIENYIRDLHGRHSTRMLTIVPIIRNIMFLAIFILFTLVVLSEIGVDVVPLLAGAGVIGIAVGFGAQTMVKDFLNGFVVVLEDLIQVGDVVKLGGRMGLVEKITIRKVQLRDLAGIVYTIPFGEVDIVENWTKDFSYYVFDIGVAYRENSDEVIEHLKSVDEDLRADENFKDLIIEPLEILGVDKFADSAVVIKARIKTRPIKQWEVGREFNRRMKFKFDEHNIEIPFPHQTIYFGEDKNGKAPSASIELLNNSHSMESKGE